MGIAETFCRVQGQGLPDELDQSLTGLVTESLLAFKGPEKGPFGQYTGEVFIKDQAHSKAVTAVGGSAIRLLRRHVSRCAKIIDCGHASLDFLTDPEVAEGCSALCQQKDVHGTDVAMHHLVGMGVG